MPPANESGMVSFWQRYWFGPAPCFDLAVMRLVAVGIQLILMTTFFFPLDTLQLRSALPDHEWEPLIILNLMNLPWGWGYRPPFEALQFVYYVAVIAGILSFIGLLTNMSLVVFAAGCVYLVAARYSFSDFHHPEAVLMIALSALALAPSGRVLSVDSWIRGRRGMGEGLPMLDQTSDFAAWPIKLIQWFFVLMYLSAVYSKLTLGGADWANGFTLQYYLARDGLRWDSALAYWLSHYHILVVLGQYGVLVFQATFSLAVMFPMLRWIYVPGGLFLHTFIFLTLTAPFFEWIALYVVFIPWTAALKLYRGRVDRMPEPAVKVT